MLDDESRAILRQFQANPGLTVPELAALVRMTPARITRRLDRLQEDGVIKGQEAVINWQALGYTVHVALRITLDKTVARAFDEFMTAVAVDAIGCGAAHGAVGRKAGPVATRDVAADQAAARGGCDCRAAAQARPTKAWVWRDGFPWCEARHEGAGEP